MKVKFTAAEEKIIRCLYEHHWPLSTNDIAKRTGLGWGTVKKYLEGLEEKGIVGKLTNPEIKTIYWELEFD